jgi:2,3-diketo-5-methylthiopentyl-1-phosphate enolase
MGAQKYRKEFYGLYESLDPEAYIIGIYLAKAKTKDYIRLAGEVIIEQTTGSWTKVPLETPELMAKHGGKVINIFEVPDYEYDAPEDDLRTFVMELAFPTINYTSQIPMLLSTVMGNISMMGTLKLLDLKFPKSFAAGFPGPKFGIDGMRKYLNVPERPLLNTMIKPCTGLSPAVAAEQCYQAALGGVDVVKDDELVANASYSKVVERVKAFMASEKRAFEQTGEHTYYAVNITDNPHKILENAKAARDAGANMLMLNTLTAGFGSLQMLAESGFNLPIMSHPDYAGVLSWSAESGLSSHMTLGKFLRMCGADISVYPTHWGKLPISNEQAVKIQYSLQYPLYDMKGAWPMPSGGMTQGMTEEVMHLMGNDIIIGAGAAIHAHPMGTTAGGKAFRQAIDAVMAGRCLSDAAREYKELGEAVQAWGIPGVSEKDIFGLKM